MSDVGAASFGSVEVCCEYTLEDFREGLAQQSRQNKPRPVRLVRLKNAAWFVFFIGFLLFLAWEDLTNADQIVRSNAVPAVAGWSALVVSAAGAFLTTSILFITILISKARNSKRKFSRHYAKALLLLIFALVLGTYAVVPAIVQNPPSFVKRPLPPRSLTMLCVIPWAIGFTCLIVVFGILQGRKLKRSFLERSGLAQAVVFVFDDDGVIVRRARVTASYQWAFFARAWETCHLLVLQDEREKRHIIPKRFIADLPDDARIRALLFNHIPNTKFLSEQRGFAIAPVPVIPIDDSSSADAEGSASA